MRIENLLTTTMLGLGKVAVPKIYAYVQKRTCGFVTGSGIIVECLNKYRDLMDIATHSPQAIHRRQKWVFPLWLRCITLALCILTLETKISL